MPVFEYECRKCGHVTAFLERAGSEDAHVCEGCGSGKTVKVLSSFATGFSPSASVCEEAGCPGAAAGGCPADDGRMDCPR